MTDRMVIVQWADVTGTGFSPQRGADAAPPRYWSVAETLLGRDLTQPPEWLNTSGDHPLWTMRRVTVDGGKRWCFVVQGRRGEFGVAGTCRFGFAPADFDAWEAWQAGTAEVAGKRLGAHALSLGEQRLKDAVRAIFRATACERMAIPVDGGPEEAARVIGCVLRAVPEPIAQGWSWSTCALLPPARLPVVSGAWPPEFRRWEPDLAHALGQVFDQPSVSQRELEHHLGPDRARDLDLLVQRALTGPLDREVRLRPLTEVIDQLVRPRRAARLEDVEEKLGSVDRDELLGAYRKHFDRWMAGSPEQVGERLRVEDDDRMAAALLGGLLKNKRKARDNPLDLPTVSRPGPSAWRDRLAGLLRAHYELDELHLYAKQWTMGDGPWADLDDAAAGRDWLRGLGLNEVTYPDLYRARPAAIVDEINQEGRVTDVARAEFALSHDQLADLRDVCGRIEAIPAGDAAALIQSATSRRPKLSTKDAVALQEIAGLLTSACTRQGSPEDWQNWVSDLLVATSRRQSVAVQLMIGAWNILDRHAPDVPNEQLLQTCTRVIPVEKLPVEIREVIDQALRERHQVRQPVAASVPAISRHDSGVPPQDPMPPLPLRRTSEHSWSGRRPAGDWLRLHWKTALVLSGVAAFAVVLVFTIYAIFGLAPDDQPDGRASNDAGPPPTVPRPAAEALHLAPPVPATPPQQQADADYKKFTEWRDPARRPRIELLVLIIADRREDQDRANRLIDQLRGSYSIVEHKMIRHRSDSGQLSPLDVLVVTTVK